MSGSGRSIHEKYARIRLRWLNRSRILELVSSSSCGLRCCCYWSCACRRFAGRGHRVWADPADDRCGHHNHFHVVVPSMPFTSSPRESINSHTLRIILLYYNLLYIQAMGFGLAVGILIDAFIVRMTIVPVVMTLLGRSAWWLSKWLDKLLPHISIEGENK
jgi:MMPL family protein